MTTISQSILSSRPFSEARTTLPSFSIALLLLRSSFRNLQLYFQIAQSRSLNGQRNDLFAGGFLRQTVQKRVFRAAAHNVQLLSPL